MTTNSLIIHTFDVTQTDSGHSSKLEVAGSKFSIRSTIICSDKTLRDNWNTAYKSYPCKAVSAWAVPDSGMMMWLVVSIAWVSVTLWGASFPPSHATAAVSLVVLVGCHCETFIFWYCAGSSFSGLLCCIILFWLKIWMKTWEHNSARGKMTYVR